MSPPISSAICFSNFSCITSLENKESDQTALKVEQKSETIFCKRAREEEYSPQKRRKQNEQIKPLTTLSKERGAKGSEEVDWNLFFHGEMFLRALGNGEEDPLYVFEDKWADNLISQEGPQTINYEDGNQYQGDVVNGKPHGKGKLITQLGTTYEGTFVEGKLQGQGILTDLEKNKYIGNFLNGIPSGKGTLFLSRNDIKSDTWTVVSNNNRLTHYLQTESGEIYNRTNRMQYKGQIVNLMPHGKGILFLENDVTYEGEFSFGHPYGKGKLRDAINNVFISDKWCGNLENAQGKIFYADRSSSDSDKLYYIGNFLARQPFGTGTMYYKNGEHYIGIFLDGKRHGSGILFSEMKTIIYAGNWTNDKEDESKRNT